MKRELHLTKPIADFVKAINERRAGDFLAVFTENAVITDEGHQYHGIAAIKKWNEEKNIGAEITLTPIDLSARDDQTVLTAEVDGNFDKTGLPDPFMMDLYFTLDENLITALSYHLAGE